MKKFIVKIVLFFSLLLLTDRILNFAMQSVRPVDYKLFVDAKKEFFKRDEYFDAIIIGDSHVADAIDPRYLKEKSGINAFNLGIYGASPYENYYTLLAALEHVKQKPKTLIFGTNPVMFSKIVVPGKYTPIIVTDFWVQWKMNLSSRKPMQASYLLKCVKEQYLFQSLFKKILGKKYVPTRGVHAIYNGYLESHNQIPATEWNTFSYSDTAYATNSTQVEYFHRTIELARANGMKVLIVNPPIWNKRLDTDRQTAFFNDFLSIINDAKKKYNLEVVNEDFRLLSSEFSQGDFLNTEHLNYYGAQKFSTALTDWFPPEKSVVSK